MEPGRGRWSLPGGYLDLGEDPREAAAREALEEAGVVVSVGAVIDVFANPIDEGGAVFILFAASYVSGEPSPDDDADAAAFFGRDEVPPLAFASTEAVVRGWLGDSPPPNLAER
jgi:ADP-ribose pyrophosphatase YjhB (NUDIX family)